MPLKYASPESVSRTETPHDRRRVISSGLFNLFAAELQETKPGEMKQQTTRGTAILLSVDAFHQETIPLEPVKVFAEAVKTTGISLRIQPAWLVSREDENPYNERTKALLREFTQLGIREGSGNIIFPSGNAVKYLSEYFKEGETPVNPYEEDPYDIKAICISPNGDILGGNVYCTDIMNLIDDYHPEN